MPNAFYYSNTAVQTTLSGSVSSGATAIGVAATTGFPGSFPYVLALDYGAAAEELVVVTAVGGSTLTVTRGHSGTSAQSHSMGAVVRHVYHAGDATDFRTHEAATASVHGVTGALVGATSVQTLTNKTLTSPVLNSATIQNGGSLAGTFTGTPTLSGAVVFSGTPSISNGAALGGTFTGSPTFSGTPAFSGGGTMGGTWAGTPTFSGNVTYTGELVASNLVRGSRALASDSMYEGRVTADAFARWFTKADGMTWWGPGNVVQDTNLYRSAANTLKTDDTLLVGGDLTVTGKFQAPNQPATLTGTTTFTFSSASQVDVAVVFPGGVFTGTPKVTATLTSLPSGSSALIVRASSITNAGMTLRCNDVAGVSRTLSITCDWIAAEG